MRPVDKTLWRAFMGETTYSTTRQFLLDTLGGYCSYCEVPLGDDLPIEHKAPKSEFPTYETRYGNLLLACSACNTAKGARPSMADGRAFYLANKSSLSGVYPNNDLDAYWLTVLSMAWPDALSGKANDIGAVPDALATLVWGGNSWDASFNLFRYQRETVSQATLATAGLLRFKQEDDSSASWAAKPRTIVTVRPNTALGTLTQQRATSTIRTLNLNYDNPVNDRAPDRRVHNRTEAWRVAQAGLNALAIAIAFDLQDTGWDGSLTTRTYSVITILRQAALLTGHWSVWASVFRPLVDALVSPWSDMAAKTHNATTYYNALFLAFLPLEDAGRLYDFQPQPAPVFIGTDLRRATY